MKLFYWDRMFCIMKRVASYGRQFCLCLSGCKRNQIVSLRSLEKAKNKILDQLKKEIKETFQGYNQTLCTNDFINEKHEALFQKVECYLNLKIPDRMVVWQGSLDQLLSNKGFDHDEVKEAAETTLENSIIRIKTDTGSFEESVIELYQALYILK